jgi:hypothetical protein
MRTQHLFYLTGLVAIFYCASCTSGKKSFEQGDYYTSVMEAVERLRKNPTHKKSSAVLENAYPQAVRYYTTQIDRYRTSNDRFKSGRMVDAYSMLNSMHDEIQRSPGALRVVTPQDFYAQMQQYTRKAAEEQYLAGEEVLAQNSREAAKAAYFHFLKAHEYAPGYEDVLNKMQHSHDLATIKVLVEQAPVPTAQYQLSAQFFQDQIEQFLFNYNENEFVRFFSGRDENIENPDQIIVFQFDDFVVGQTNNFQRTQELSRDSVVVGQVTVGEGKKSDVYGTVKATYVENKSEIISKGLMSMRVIDARSNTIALHEKFPGQFVWTTFWGNFNGDERALTNEQLQITKQRPVPPPPPQDLFIEFCRPIYAQVQGKVRNYYRGM